MTTTTELRPTPDEMRLVRALLPVLQEARDAMGQIIAGMQRLQRIAASSEIAQQVVAEVIKPLDSRGSGYVSPPIGYTSPANEAISP